VGGLAPGLLAGLGQLEVHLVAPLLEPGPGLADLHQQLHLAPDQFLGLSLYLREAGLQLLYFILYCQVIVRLGPGARAPARGPRLGADLLEGEDLPGLALFGLLYEVLKAGK
jgi:hypothetical protein